MRPSRLTPTTWEAFRDADDENDVEERTEKRSISVFDLHTLHDHLNTRANKKKSRCSTMFPIPSTERWRSQRWTSQPRPDQRASLPAIWDSERWTDFQSSRNTDTQLSCDIARNSNTFQVEKRDLSGGTFYSDFATKHGRCTAA